MNPDTEDILKLFLLNSKGRVPVQEAHKKINEIYPSLNTTRVGKVLRRTFENI